jgi:genome maintenance exonuclease 1
MFTHVELDKSNVPELECETLPTGRTYQTPEGNKYPSITTVLSLRGKEGILAWRKRVGEEVANKISRQAATRGTAVHTLAEDYLNNKEDWAKKAMPANIFSFNQIKPILDERVNNIWAQEVPLYSDKFKIAGRVDCIAEFDNELTIIDFKTSRKPKKEEWIQGYFTQAAFYAAAFYERTGVPIKKFAIIISVDDNEPQVFTGNTFDYLKELLEIRIEYAEVKGI